MDDDRVMLARLGCHLRGRGDEVVLASAPLHALWVLERSQIDVILCDLALANGDEGPLLLATVQARWPRTARLLMTGWGRHMKAARECKCAQATFFKPLDLEAVERAAQRLENKQNLNFDSVFT